MTKRNPAFITIVLTLSALEFFIAASLIFSLEPDPTNAIFLGYSAARWAIALLAIGCGITSIYLARRIHEGGLPAKMEAVLTRHFTILRSTSIALFLIGIIVLLSPPGHLGEYAEYFVRVRPLLVVITTLPFQFFAPTIFRADSKLEMGIVKPSLIALSIFAVLVGFIALTRLGVDPDTHFWNVAGVPLTALQLTIILLITFLSSHVIHKISAPTKISPIVMDVCIALLIYIIGVWVWSQTPMTKHFNALRPAPPAFQYFPYSDARIHDMGAISILEGYGIFFGQYTDKPLYMTALSMLHRVTGYDYNKLSLLHLYCMGLILPGLFWLGKQFSSRHFGIALALIILIRQRNAILLAHILAGTNPRLLLTEVPVMLGLVVLCMVVFTWIKGNRIKDGTWPYPLLAGGILGALSLLRLNPIGLLPVLVPVSALALRKTGINWRSPTLIFVLGFLMVLTPWLLTGQDASGKPYLLIKILDVINVRYVPGSPSFEQNDQAHLIATTKLASVSRSYINRSSQYIDSTSFPGFAINHSIHNMVTAFLALPDSLYQNDQTLKNLVARPYFEEKQTMTWQGELQAGQIPFLLINLFLLSLGLGWSWERWKWAGIFPAGIFVGYIITLGLARSSGSRYIVPIDWILFFYYILGIIVLLEKFTNVFETTQSDTSIFGGGNPTSFMPVFTVSILLLLGTLIPIIQIPVITQNFPACENQVNDLAHPQINMLKGKVLYPYFMGKTFYFTFLTCNQSMEIMLKDFDASLENEQSIIIGFSKEIAGQPEAIFLAENRVIQQIWVNE